MKGIQGYTVDMNDRDHNRKMFSRKNRQQRILELVQRDGHARVPDLGRELGVSEITIRRDLAAMEKKSLLERTHGGAISTRRIYKEINYHSRSDEEMENKEAIAKVAAGRITEGDTVFINGGSTTYYIFRHIRSSNVKIVTTNPGCIGQVTHPDIELILAGGRYYPESNSFYGGFTIDILQQVYASKAIIGVHGISCRYGLTTPMHYAAEATRVMINRTRGEVIVVADHRKIGLVSDFVTASVNQVSTVITDYFPDENYIKDFEDLGITVIQTKSR